MKKVYWYVSGKYPDKDFFKYGNRKPSNVWCMFETKLAVHQHCYNIHNSFGEFEESKYKDLPRDSSLDKYKEAIDHLNISDEIIEIDLWDDKEFVS